MKKIIINFPNKPTPIYIDKDATQQLAHLIKKHQVGQDACVITTANILALHGKKIKTALKKVCSSYIFITIPDSEKSKNADLALKLIKQISIFNTRKKIFLISFGGGVVGDLTGFVAAIYKRGVPYIQVPTTLLAQVDSSIGGKTAVDTSFGKNLVGAFYQPSFIVVDTNLLKTLPSSEIRIGLAEVIKYACIKDTRLFSFLEKNYRKIIAKNSEMLELIVMRCAAIKAAVVERDELDKNKIRIILNFGHTMGHAFESASHFKISHGQAISIGMAYACRLSVKLKLLDQRTCNRIIALIQEIGLPIKSKNYKEQNILKTLLHDKKFSGKTNRFVLLEKIGKTKIVENIPDTVIREVLKKINEAQINEFLG
jgi:3-dehydroquinate synthase